MSCYDIHAVGVYVVVYGVSVDDDGVVVDVGYVTGCVDVGILGIIAGMCVIVVAVVVVVVVVLVLLLLFMSVLLLMLWVIQYVVLCLRL